MPELAEVEFFRKRWSPAFGEKIIRVHLHGTKRIFRGSTETEISEALTGSKFLSSDRKAKQMLFRFSTATIGLHLGMTGELRLAAADFQPGKHDHFVLFTKTHALIFNDFRLFGRVRLSAGTADPEWWNEMPEELTARSFTVKKLAEILERRGKAPLKAVLLMQELFPGIGNWMADEILWRAGLPPDRRSGGLPAEAVTYLHREIREVIKISLKTIGEATGEEPGDPPADWLFHERWTAKGVCPKHKTALRTATVGGRTTRWCPVCQPL
ncbi:MAG TPA: DNA-formamidopyrimidine glycosylase family protein [Chthoniobacterales bacterium]